MIVSEVLDLPQSFLAPWAALLVVHSTVYRTFAQGARQVGAAVVGVVLAWAVGNSLGVDTLSVAVLLLVGLVLGSPPWFRGEATTVAATGLIVLTTGFAGDDDVLLSRLADTGIGIAVGLAVNFAVWPPLRRRTAIAAMDALDDRVGELLQDIAAGLGAGAGTEDLDGWVERTRDLDDDVDHAWALVRQATESARLNPRRSAGPLRDPDEWVALLERHRAGRGRDPQHGCAPCPGAPTASPAGSRLPGRVPRGHAAGRAAPSRGRPEPDPRLRGAAGPAGRAPSTPRRRPRSGRSMAALLVNLRNTLDAMDEVAPRTRCASRRCRSAGAEQLRTARGQRSTARFTQVDATTMPTFS